MGHLIIEQVDKKTQNTGRVDLFIRYMPAPRISLDQWRALLAVVDEGSYAKAAKALHKSQSSVTYAVQQLESQLGVKAFKIEGARRALRHGRAPLPPRPLPAR